MTTTVLKNDDLSYAAEVILHGGLVAMPTDTVYGLAANGLDADAVTKIYDVKGRPAVKPIILLLPDIAAATKVCTSVPKTALLLACQFWPGALTMILPRRDNLPDIVTAGGPTVGVRCPNHPKTLELLRLTGVPLAVPSANLTGMQAPKTAGEVLEYFDGKIDCIIDGGACELGLESTIVDLTAEPPKVVRQGAIPEEEMRRVIYSA